MEIANFNYQSKINYLNNNKNIKAVQKSAINQTKNNLYSPTTAQYLAFTGGYSINLKETKENLSSDDYPCDIENMVNETLEHGNDKNKTLYDIHFEKYKNILDCYSLEELKEQYEEFNDVVSVLDVDTRKDSYIDKYLNESLEEFSLDEDLTLSLIKLYWGQGFSLNDLTKFIEAQSGEKINLYYTMKKLNIPLMDKKYAQVLKLSNKEYNERFCEEMSLKLRQAKESRLQKSQGEAVVIPRGPLSDAHKRKISESLKKYYSGHPEKIYQQSQRQKEFYKQNPEFQKEISIAMKYAWNSTSEGKSVKKHLSKFMKKFNQTIKDEELFLNTPLSNEKQNALDAFWKKNTWARGSFSIAATKGWQYAKDNAAKLIKYGTDERQHLSFSTLPTQLRNNIEKFAQKNYPDKEYQIDKIVLYEGEQIEMGKRFDDIDRNSNAIIHAYSSMYPKLNDQLASCKQIALIKIKKDLEENSSKLPESFKQNPEKRKEFNIFLEKLFEKTPIYHYNAMFGWNKTPYDNIEVTTLDRLIIKLMDTCLMLDSADFAQYYQKTIDSIWPHVENDRYENLHFIFE